MRKQKSTFHYITRAIVWLMLLTLIAGVVIGVIINF